MKPLLILLGSFFLGLGFLGIFIPGLPTTPFLLLAAGCYVRSSDRLYTWLLNHYIFGRHIQNFRENRSISLHSKIISLIAMWLMISLSVFVFIKIFWIRILIAILGVIGTVVILLIRTSKNN
ncbi:YbaN family protein [bacterium]|nr:YbaN family protein [bacterium]